MKSTWIVPLGKSPYPLKGRIGPEKQQDWYAELNRAAVISRLVPKSEILIISGLKISGHEYEADLYERTLREMGINNVRVIKEGYQTIDQIDLVFDLATREDRDVLFISSTLHFLRVQWLIQRNPLRKKANRVEHIAVWGNPRLTEGLTDIALSVVYPIIDLLGGQQWFRNAVDNRRKNGKF